MSAVETFPSPSILVRDARADDMPVLQAIYAHHVLNSVATFEEVPPDLAEMNRRREEIQARGLPYVAAERDGVVRGYAYCNTFRARSAYRFTVEDSVYVAPDATGQGFGRSALREVIRRATALGMRQMVAVIGDSANSASIGMHESLGFHREAVLHAVGFKHGRWIDGVIMQLALGEGDSTPPAR
ncbi:MAG TPA: GNAT family N-acetyltransferase [Hypericibacter adhaerens]|jgi:phosphinothricin acetyltransferase|uniref:GNAT family N-acetyltransferase n=1 Tax=Hypericibacter adhaerens TaxID=2602016 RepID=UPI002BCD8FF3|nr:GNAT family N-acetyltransferase [Hypericibacter adhaerens]HWA43046.1 GNAT family N-acetyltransferase [Hypericibacter adhaerens]